MIWSQDPKISTRGTDWHTMCQTTTGFCNYEDIQYMKDYQTSLKWLAVAIPLVETRERERQEIERQERERLERL